MHAEAQSSGMECPEIQELLSDLLDVRRGESPTPEVSPLGDPAVLAGVEQHVARCEACAARLNSLSELGAVFSEFSVAEKPAQEFADYGMRVRARMSGNDFEAPLDDSLSPPPSSGHHWWLVALSSAAAMLAVSLLIFPKLTPRKIPQIAVEQKHSEPETQRMVADNDRPKETGKSEVKVEDTSLKPFPSTKQHSAELQIPYKEPGLVMAHPSHGPSHILPVGNLFGEKKSRGGVWLQKLQEVNRAFQDGPILLGEPVDEVSTSRPLFGARILGAPVEGRRFQNEPEGLYVASVLPNGPAYRIGLKKGDYIIRVGVPDGKDGNYFDPYPTSDWIQTVLFMKVINGIGKDREILVDYQRPSGGDLILKTGRAKLGEYKSILPIDKPRP